MSSFQKYKEQIESIISDIRKLHKFSDFSSLDVELKEIKESINDNEFRVTVVGEFSAGKSTFLNALIGKDVLPHGVNETTATLTYLHNISKEDSRCNTIVIHFADGKRKDETYSLEDSRQVLIDYATASSEKVKVVKEISSLEIFVPFLGTNDPIVLIDTPGMNGMADGHREVTLAEIKQSHASICLFHLRGMGKTDLEFVNELAKYQNKIFFVINAIDGLNSDEGESKASKLASFTEEINANLSSLRVPKDCIFAVSSLKALVSKDCSINHLYSTDNETLTAEKRRKCWEESYFQEFENAFFSYLRNNEKDIQKYQSSALRIQSILEGLLDSSTQEKDIRQLERENCPEKKRLQHILDEVNGKMKSNQAKIENKLSSLMEDLGDEVRKLIKSDCNGFYDSVIRDIQSMTFENAKEAVVKNINGQKMKNFWAKESSMLQDHIERVSENIYAEVLEEVQRKLPSINFNLDKHIDIQVPKDQSDNNVYGMEDMLSRLRQQQREKTAELKVAEGTPGADSIRGDLASIERQIDNTRNEKRRQLNNLGSRPSVEVVYRTERRKKGLLRRVWNFFSGGDYYEDVQVPEYDYSAQERYDNRKYEIETNATNQISRLNQQQRVLESQLGKAEQNDVKKKVLQSHLAGIERQIREVEAERAKLEKEARTTMLKEYQKVLKEQATKQLSANGGTLTANLIDTCIKYISRCEAFLKDRISVEYKERTSHIVNQLNTMLDKIENQGDNKDNAQKVQLLGRDINIIQKDINIAKNIINGL